MCTLAHMKIITRTVWVLSLVSLFTDVAGEMLYPVMPLYLKSIGFSVVLIGVLEGFAEATAGLSKGYFGKLSDHSGKRVPFVQLGYILSSVSKPLLALFAAPLWVFFTRTLDRLGKGIRTGARDAILSDEAAPGTKGKVFGFHRALDTTGAVLGPALALVYLLFYPEDYKTLFVIAVIPGFLAVMGSFLIKEKQLQKKENLSRVSFFSFLKYWKTSSANYRRVVLGLLVFTLFNSSDIFLLLKAKEAGLNDSAVIMVYIFYNLVYAIFSFPLGVMADKVGLKSVFVFGLASFAAVYFGMAFNENTTVFYALFFLYGVYAAATEGISKAWITQESEKKDTATAIGTYAAFQSVCTMLASAFAGFIWFRFGAAATFIVTGTVAFGVSVYFYRMGASDSIE